SISIGPRFCCNQRFRPRRDRRWAAPILEKRDHMQVDREAFRIVSYLDYDNVGDRIVPLMPLWDGNEWHHWLPHERQIIKMQMFGLVTGEYVAVQQERATDLAFQFLEFGWQRASWPELVSFWRHLMDDVQNLGASVAK